MIKFLYPYNMEKVRQSCQFDFDAITEAAQKTEDKLFLNFVHDQR